MLETDKGYVLHELSVKLEFLDQVKKIPAEKKLREAETFSSNDNGEWDIHSNINSSAMTIFVHAMVKYPPNSIDINKNFDDLIKENKEEFIKHWNSVMGY